MGGQKVVNYSFTTQLPGQKITYAVYYNDKGSSAPDEATARKDARAFLLGRSLPLSTKEIKLGQIQGEEIEYIGFAKDNTSYYGRGRFLITGSHVYTLDVSYPHGQQVEADIQTFLNSFKITASPATSSTTTASAGAPNTIEIAVDPAVTAGVTKSLPGIPDLAVKMFVSDATAVDVTNNLDAFIVSTGYKFALPGETKPAKQGDSYGAFYTKTGGPDIFLAVAPVSDDPAQMAQTLKDLALPGLEQTDPTKLQAQLKGHKSLVISLGGTGLGQVLFNNSGPATPAATTAPVATTKPVAITTPVPATTKAAIADPTEIALDPAIKAALTKELAAVSDLTITMYVSDDAPQHLATYIEESFIQSGYKFNIPGATKLIQSGTGFVGNYAKDGVPEALFEVGTLSDDPAQLAKNFKELDVPGTDQLDVAKFQAATKGHKSLVVLLRGTGLSKAIYGSGSTGATPAATTAAATNSDLQEITVDPTIQSAYTKQVSSASGVTVKMFVSDTSPYDVGTTIKSGLLKTGYKFAVPNHTQLFNFDAHTYSGAYTQDGTPDLWVGVGTLSDNQTQLVSYVRELRIPGIDQTDTTKFLATLKGHKALIVLVSGTNLVKALYTK